MSASALPVSRSIARSPIDTMPAGRPSCTTGMRRTFCSRTTAIAAPSGRATAARGLLAHAADRVLDGLVDGERRRVVRAALRDARRRRVLAGRHGAHGDVA